MRQLFTWRFLLAVAAVAVLVLVVRAVLADDDTLESVIAPEQIERRIDLIDPIVDATMSADFAVQRNGVTEGVLELSLRDDRTMRIVPGTLGSLDCDELTAPGRCAVFADLLGDAVIWFAIVPTAPRSTVELPPVVELVDGRAVFENGWRIPYAPVIERDCEGEEIVSFSDFLRRFAENSVTIVDLETAEVVAVRCVDPGDD